MENSGTRLQWNDGFCTGVTEIDEEHQTVILLYNDMLRAMEAQASPYMISETIDSLLFFLRHHFTREEKIMAERGYDGLAEHAAGHDRFESVARTFYMGLGLGIGDGGESFAGFARSWIVEHFTVEREFPAAASP